MKWISINRDVKKVGESVTEAEKRKVRRIIRDAFPKCDLKASKVEVTVDEMVRYFSVRDPAMSHSLVYTGKY